MTKAYFKDLYIFDFMRFISLYIMILLMFMASCKEMEQNGMKSLDLSPYGLQLSILAPDSAIVKVKDYDFMRDITIRKGDHFDIQLFEFQSGKNDPASEKERQIAAIQKDPSFLEIIKEYDQGFIYSRQLDSTTIKYDFRYIRFLEEKQLIFQSGLLTSFSLEDIEKMLEAVQVSPVN